MQLSKTTPRLINATVFAGLLLVSAAAPAASQCKGMQQDVCAAKAECTWVNGYLRKDGRSVSSHCKTKARRKSADQAGLGSVKLGSTK
jgi:hypothetical protein